ncbi:GNAT family N-acetyltransferase [Myxococcota bacterium]|nr:GNAT family N-acetyltransferase [Myxococcota bacterium]MBU1429742.1 GNAT family N-acetyltransferase [Myxococcota bacterium]MBU1897958.1 GNAT family N-acetyltransferase [Myxococcota bacterium]
MPWISFDALEARAAEFDALVSQTPEVDLFCTSSAWVLSAREAFSPTAEPLIWAGATGFVALMVQQMSSGQRVALPLEYGWGLAAPFAGPDPDTLIEELRWAMSDMPVDCDGGLFFGGIIEDGRWYKALRRSFHREWLFGVGQRRGRRITNLEGGEAGFWSRRSAKFRANLRRAARAGERAGLRYEYHRAPDEALSSALFQRIIRLERESWKGINHVGINRGEARRFYKAMVGRLGRRGDLRVLFLKDGEADIGFLFGAVFGGVFRGLQMSYHRAHQRHAPGNLLQWGIIQRLCAEGIGLYDLGMEMAYKHRWAEEAPETLTFALLPPTPERLMRAL